MQLKYACTIVSSNITTESFACSVIKNPQALKSFVDGKKKKARIYGPSIFIFLSEEKNLLNDYLSQNTRSKTVTFEM
jgi:hypothetical protein